jgi:hypothetical protein
MTMAAQFLARPNEPLRTYRAWRRLEGANPRFNKEAWLEVITELRADGTFTWTPLKNGGSDYILHKVLEPALEGEADALRNPRAASALTRDNYEFADGPLIGNGLARVKLTPRRKDKMLLDGWLALSAEDADLVEVCGRLVKNPSFWITKVHIARWYGRVAGARVPVAVASTASVRIVGESTFRMTYRYETINGRDVAALGAGAAAAALARPSVCPSAK